MNKQPELADIYTKLQQDGRVSRVIGNRDVLILLSVIWILQLTRKDSQRLPDAGLMQELLTQQSPMPRVVWAVHNAILISECIFQLLEILWSNNYFLNASWCHFSPSLAYWLVVWEADTAGKLQLHQGSTSLKVRLTWQACTTTSKPWDLRFSQSTHIQTD